MRQRGLGLPGRLGTGVALGICSVAVVANHIPTCLFCGDVIGVYEPIVIVEHEGDRETSLAREPTLHARPGILVAHRACVPSGWPEQKD